MNLARRFPPRPSVLATLASVAFALGRAPTAQCPLPDDLDGGPCCALATESIPWFNQITQDSLDICWRDCGIEFVGNSRAIWTPIKVLPATGPDCGYRLARLELLDAAANVKWSGTMRLLYSRTWLELDGSGTPMQVWRFLVNGDLRPTVFAGPLPCPVPACAPVFGGRARVTGYIDFVQSCVAPGTRIAWMLTHACDPIDHAPGFPRAGVFHPERTFSFVGPAAGFAPAPVTPVESTPSSSFEALRRLRYPLPGTTGPVRCEFEERLNHSLAPHTVFCMCNTSPAFAMQWRTGPLTVTSACGATLGAPGTILPGFVSMGLGSWTVPGTYPGLESLRWNAGSYTESDPCTGVVRSTIFYGATTLGGFPARVVQSGGAGGPLPAIFIDQANSIAPGGAALANVPYRSDLVLNLNH